MSKCKTTADVLRRAASTLEMCDGTEVWWRTCVKFNGAVLANTGADIFGDPELFEFAHCLLDGKPVFTGDVVYGVYGGMWEVQESGSPLLHNLSGYTWTKQTPRKWIEINGEPLPAPDGDFSTGYFSGVQGYYYKNSNTAQIVFKALQKLMESGK